VNMVENGSLEGASLVGSICWMGHILSEFVLNKFCKCSMVVKTWGGNTTVCCDRVGQKYGNDVHCSHKGL